MLKPRPYQQLYVKVTVLLYCNKQVETTLCSVQLAEMLQVARCFDNVAGVHKALFFYTVSKKRH